METSSPLGVLEVTPKTFVDILSLADSSYGIGNPESGVRTAYFDTVEAADIAAIEASQDGHVWAVWDETDGELMSLVFQEKVFE